MNIRRAIKDDIPRLIDLLTQIRMVHAELRPDLFDKDVTKYNDEQLNKMIDDDNSPIFVAVIDNNVVGYAMCQKRYNSSLISKKVLHLDDLCVDEKYRHQGIGEALFNFVKEEARKDGCYEITLNSWPGNEAAQNFYKKMGTKTRSIVLEYILNE